MGPDTPEEMMGRFVEAFEVIAATAKGDGPKTVLAAWPDYRRKIARRRRVYSPAAIGRAEEALTWFSLIEDTDSRRALQFEIMCKAGGGKFSKVCESFGWKRSTVTSRNKVLLKKLACRLKEAD
ncbi:DUF6362 family protein [Roseibium aggregatum]|uniref:DUF6362 domain-containing protein n=1 Tax=Roseibium aggregatum TaxID=187304 RepID=A0A939J754_9HYPH|nr:DUF6362 family protein [Roseibium aggregatum]MBN9673469.1 hypothetical protein [Roseibium aggregatum]